MSDTPSSEALPNRFNFEEARPRIYRVWEEGGFFEAEPNSKRKPYSIVIPPPNVTGALHLGHALNNTLQDTMIRMKRMQGFETLWMPGMDHAGIATQAVVERRLKEEEGLTRHDLGREKLVERIWQWKEEYGERILGQLKQMGCSCDWRRTRFTLDDVCAKAVRQTFFDLFSQGLIYRGKRLVNWDTFLQTAVSDDEVFHEVVKGHFWHFSYPVIDPKPGEPTHVTIATTRPETMLGDTAVAVHPDPEAALNKVEAELRDRLAATPAKDKSAVQLQIDNVVQRRAEVLPALRQLRDMAKDGRMLMLPLVDREIPLIADEWAKPELGSGCVKITPAHDPNDYEVGLRQKLPMINILNRDGTLDENAGRYQGLKIQEARKRVVADLDELGLLGEVEDRDIDLAHSDRSKTPIEPFLADQWFVKMDQLAQSAMDAVTDERVNIFPQRYTKSYLDWLSEKRDWPVGRQLWWGHRIPIWSKEWSEEGEHQLNALADDWAHISVLKVEGTEEQSAMLLVCLTPGHEADEKRLEAQGFTQEEDVLDTWFSSALWPHSTLGWPDKNDALDYFYPTSVLITSRDIITLWVARMVLTGLNNMHEIPFHEVFIHPKILDGYGETMSKSKGNGVDPIDVIEKFGPDALRFGLAYLTTETQDVRMPVQFECPHCETLTEQTKKNRELPRVACQKCGKEFSTQWARKDEDKSLPRGAVVSERFEQARNFCNKLWNASRFAMMNLEGYEAGVVSDADLAVEDRWLLSRLATVTEEVTQSLETYHFADAMRSLYDFAWDDFCSFYIEIAKERLQNDATRVTAQRVLAYALDNLLRLLHPVAPFITEEIWGLLAQFAPTRGLTEIGKPVERVIVAPWPIADEKRKDAKIEAEFKSFQNVLGAVREIRSRQNIAPKKAIEFVVKADTEAIALLEPLKPYFAGMANATVADWGPDVEPPATNAHINLQGIDVYVNLAGLIDVSAEIERLEKDAGKLQGLIQGKEKKLDNANFVDRAPADVVAKERESLAGFKEQLKAVRMSLEALKSQN
ncbi:MAG: valine--tRNA ligase [Planctomycetaceae bacterium]|nr:valine--tRNA ligase [Planctomycetales bacterium]MCB9925701.1 valine--tRNA ligase [Planctomycetaceae bacterium]